MRRDTTRLQDDSGIWSSFKSRLKASQHPGKSLFMARILCVDDSSEFYLYLTSVLKEHSLTQAATIADALRMVGSGRDSFDLILLDLSLPDGNGMKVLPQMKDAFLNKTVPIIVLSSDSDVVSKVAAFGIGADDYISKPPNSSELRARIEARLRNVNMSEQRSKHITFADLTIDSERMCVDFRNDTGAHKVLDLTPSEFKILRLVTSRPGHVFTRDYMIDSVWGVGKFVGPRTIDAHVSHLRKKLEDSRVQIETVQSVGYKATTRDTQ